MSVTDQVDALQKHADDVKSSFEDARKESSGADPGTDQEGQSRRRGAARRSWTREPARPTSVPRASGRP